MIPRGKTDSELAQLTWTLRNLKSSKSHQRRDALTEIAYSRDLRYIPALMELLVGDPLYPTQHDISVALHSFDTTAVPSLLETLASSHSRTRFHAALALRELTDERAVRPLIAALESDPDDGVRRAAAQALGSAHDPRALFPLARALEGPAAIANAAALSLARYGDLQAIRSWLTEFPDLQDIDGKLLLIQRLTQQRQEGEPVAGGAGPTLGCSVCGDALPSLAVVGGLSSSLSSRRSDGAFCVKCRARWCPYCRLSETERGQHRRCGGQSREFPVTV